MRPLTLRLSVFFTLSLIFAAAAAAPAKAQMISWSRYGIGYVSSPPDMMAGVDGYILFPSLGGLGIYVDAKFDVQSPAHDSKFLSDMTDADVLNTVTGAVFQDKKDSYRSFNVALVRPITPGLMLYAGGGYIQRRRYHEYREPAQELGQFGLFWVAVPENSTKTGHAMFGAFLRLGRHLAFQTGFEATPTAFTLGATLKFPGR